MQHKDYYALLGVDRASPQDEITRVYRRLAREYHPDVNPHDAEAGRRFAEINEAYHVLSNPEKRAQYDQQLVNAQSAFQPGLSSEEDALAGQPAAHPQSEVVRWEDVEGEAGDLAAPIAEVANQVADELREALRDFGKELEEIVRTFGDAAGNRGGRTGFPPYGGRPPYNGRPPHGGKPPRR